MANIAAVCDTSAELSNQILQQFFQCIAEHSRSKKKEIRICLDKEKLGSICINKNG